jgi:hypothetical protein
MSVIVLAVVIKKGYKSKTGLFLLFLNLELIKVVRKVYHMLVFQVDSKLLNRWI